MTSVFFTKTLKFDCMNSRGRVFSTSSQTLQTFKINSHYRCIFLFRVIDIWDSFSGEKDDVFIFNKNGEKTSIKAGTSRDATSTSHMGEEDATCADAKNIKVV